MPTYSIPQILFISFHILSSSLIIILIIIFYRRKSFITKWTLIQICLTILGFSIFTIPSVIFYGDKIISEAPSSQFCSIATKIAMFFHYPIVLFPSVLSCYLWFLVVKSNVNLENDTLRWVSAFIWSVSLVYLLSTLILTRNERTVVTFMYCKLKNNWFNYYTFSCVVGVMTLISFFFGGTFDQINV